MDNDKRYTGPERTEDGAILDAGPISYEELAALRVPTEELIDEALEEFDRLCDEIDRELGLMDGQDGGK